MKFVMKKRSMTDTVSKVLKAVKKPKKVYFLFLLGHDFKLIQI